MTQFRYAWRRTWPDAEDDFAMSDGLLQVGRMYKHASHRSPDEWAWSLHGLLFAAVRLNGYAAGRMSGSTREIATHMEATYDRLLPESAGLGLSVRDEIAHYLKRGLALPLPAQFRQAVFLEGMPVEDANRLYRPTYSHGEVVVTRRQSRRQ